VKRDPITRESLRGAGLGAFFRRAELEAAGGTRGDLERLLRHGEIERVSRGLFHFTDAEPTEKYSVASVCAAVPRAIVCLLTALQVHEIGTQLPADVWIAIPHKAEPPRLRSVRMRLIRFSGAALTYGVEDTKFEGVPARITNPTRTVLDCFRLQRRVGIEAAREALFDALRQRKVTVDSLYRAMDVLPSRRLRAVLEAMP
jgi:predicted transcriptional regulator of viral defense system